MKIGEELKDQDLISTQLCNIGIVYSRQGDHSMSLQYSLKSLEICEELGDKSFTAILLVNIGLDYTNLAEYVLALEYYFKALTITEELGYKSHAAAALSNIGLVYNEQRKVSSETSEEEENYSKALDYYFRALRMAQQIPDKKMISRSMGNIGALYLSQAHYFKAEQYLLKALELSIEIREIYLQNEQYPYLSELYETTGKYEQALKYYKEYSITKDSLFNEEKSKDIGRLEAKHEFETEEIEQKRKAEELARIETAVKDRRDNLQYSGILIFIVLLFAAVFMLGRFSIPVRLAEGMVFFSFLLFFEFTLVLLDPYIERYSSGAPAIKLFFNALLAGLIFPLHSFFESKLKNRIIK